MTNSNRSSAGLRALLVSIVMAFGAEARAALLLNYGASAGDAAMPHVDDGYQPTTLPTGHAFGFYGTFYNQVYVNTNGLISFTNGIAAYVPGALPMNPNQGAFTAPFWTDVDISGTNRGEVYFRGGTDAATLATLQSIVGAQFPKQAIAVHTDRTAQTAATKVVYIDVTNVPVNLTYYFVTTWAQVAYFGNTSADRNTFQCICTGDDVHSFVLFSYDTIKVLAAADGSIADTKVGFDSGNAVTAFSVADGTAGFLNGLVSGSNLGVRTSIGSSYAGFPFYGAAGAAYTPTSAEIAALGLPAGAGNLISQYTTNIPGVYVYETDGSVIGAPPSQTYTLSAIAAPPPPPPPPGITEVTYQGAYSSSATYLAGDIVTYNGVSYIATAPNVGAVPDNATGSWTVFAQGAPGATGPQGPAGPAGLPGATGAMGPSGAVGQQGPAGSVGPAGAQGPKGDIGAPGAPGPVGPAGATGPQGIAGPAGGVGPVGPVGATGPQGPAGNMGPAGAQGPKGDVGATGATGSPGGIGSIGPQGPIGPIGFTGPQGVAGPAGTAGPVGQAGPAGPTGATGAAGPMGPIGPQGPTAPIGVYPVRTITDPDNPVPLLLSDTVIFVDTSKNDSATLVLPSAVGSGGRYFMIKVRSGKKSRVSVVAPSRQMIDGSGSPVTLTLGETVTIVSDGAGWNTVMGP